MFDGTSISQKEAHGAFTKTSIPLLVSFKVGAYLFLIFLFDFFDFFSLSIVVPFVLLTFRSVQATIDGVHVDLLGLP